MKTVGNVILITVICNAIFWVFMALRPAHAADDADGMYFGICIVEEVPEGQYNCLVMEAGDGSFKTCAIMRQLAMEQKLMVTQCRRSKKDVKREMDKLWNSKS